MIAGWQLAGLGVGRSERRSLLRRGQIAAIEPGPGLYRLVDGSFDERFDLWSAVLRAGSGAFLYRRSAASLWGFDGAELGPIEVAVPAGGRRPRLANVHRIATGPDELVRLDSMPVTSVSRTLVDLGAVADVHLVERGLEWALRRRYLSVGGLDALAASAAARRTPGGRVLGEVLSARPLGAAPTDSDAETLFVQLARSMGVPDPVRQYSVTLRGRQYRLDFAWPTIRVAVEIDGAWVHGPDRLTADLYRQNQVVLDGWLILRFSWYSLTQLPDVVRRDLATAWSMRPVLGRLV